MMCANKCGPSLPCFRCEFEGPCARRLYNDDGGSYYLPGMGALPGKYYDKAIWAGAFLTLCTYCLVEQGARPAFITFLVLTMLLCCCPYAGDYPAGAEEAAFVAKQAAKKAKEAEMSQK